MFYALDKNGCFLGGSIFPGIRVSLNALSDSAAQLPRINTEIRGTVKTICSNSVDSMKSGIILGTASMIDGMTVRCRESLGENGASASVVITIVIEMGGTRINPRFVTTSTISMAISIAIATRLRVFCEF